MPKSFYNTPENKTKAVEATTQRVAELQKALSNMAWRRQWFGKATDGGGNSPSFSERFGVSDAEFKQAAEEMKMLTGWLKTAQSAGTSFSQIPEAPFGGN